MHELSLAQAIVENVEKMAKEEGAKRVKSVTVSIGELSGVVKSAMEFCFPEAAKGTFLDGTELIVEEVPLTIYCKSCDHKEAIQDFKIECSKCNKQEVEVVAGKDFKLKTMEIE